MCNSLFDWCLVFSTDLLFLNDLFHCGSLAFSIPKKAVKVFPSNASTVGLTQTTFFKSKIFLFMHDFIIIKEVWCSRWGPIPFKSEEKKKAFSESAETNPVTVPPAAQPGELPWRLAVSSITSSFLYLFEAFSLQRKMMRARTRAKCCVRTSKAFLITYKFLP